MLTLAATQTIAGLAGTGSAITVTLLGDEISSSDAFKVLYQGTLPTSATVLYTATGVQALVKAIALFNTTGGAVTVTMYVNGTASTNAVWGGVIPSNGKATYADGQWAVYDANGYPQYAGSTGPQGIQGIQGIQGPAGPTAGPDTIDNTMIVNMAQSTIKGRAAGAGTGDPTDLTPAQVKTLLAIANTDISGLGTLSTQSGTFSGTSSGTNTGDVTLGAAGATPNANAASLAAQVLTLQPASALYPGNLTPAQFTKLAGYYDAVADFGFVGDHRVCAEIGSVVTVMTAGSNVVTLTNTAPFTSTAVDGGKRITIGGAGTAGQPLVGWIQTVSSASSCTIVTTKGGGTAQNAVNTVIANASFYVMVQFGTDNTAAITTMQTTINTQVFPAAYVRWPNSATDRYAFPIGVTFNKPITFEGAQGGVSTDVGDYTKAGGTCLAWWGTNTGQATFDGFIKIVPVTGASAQPLNAVAMRHFWIDCRNGDQNAALYGIQLYDCVGMSVDDFFVMDAIAAGVDFGVAEPLGVTASVSRGIIGNLRVRSLESQIISQFVATYNNSTALTAVSPLFTAADVGKLVVGPGIPGGTTLSAQAGAAGTLSQASTGGLFTGSALTFLPNTTPTTTTSAITLTTSGQSLVLAAINGLTPSGYAWVQTTVGTPCLINYTGGGGTTTLTGCTVSASDAVFGYVTVSGSNVVQAIPGNGACVKFSGSTTANANLCFLPMWMLAHGSTWGPAAIDCRNIDTQTFTQVVINGGSNVNDGNINRIRKPGLRLGGSNTNVGLTSRNVVAYNCEFGAGGVSSMGLMQDGATRMLYPAGPNYCDLYQLANGSPVPTVERFSSFSWSPNGGLRPNDVGPASVAIQTIAASTLTLVTGSLLSVPPQLWQPGTTIRWTLNGTMATGAAVANLFQIRIGTLATTADALIAASTFAAGAVGSVGFHVVIEFTIRTNGAAATSWANFSAISHTNVGLVTTPNITGVAGTAFSTVTSGIQYASIAYTGGVGTSTSFQQVTTEVVKSANP